MPTKKIYCANPKCRNGFIPTEPNQIYCSDKCIEDMVNIHAGKRYTTLSIERTLRDEFKQIQLDVMKQIKKNITYSEILRSLISVVNAGDKIISIIVDDLKKVINNG